MQRGVRRLSSFTPNLQPLAHLSTANRVHCARRPPLVSAIFLGLRSKHRTARSSDNASQFRMSSCPSPPKSRICVLGAGNFGSCLADHLADSEHDVLLWSREEDLVKHFNECHRNPQYLQDHEFPKNITAIGPELPSSEAIKDVDVLLFAIPTEGLRYFQTLPCPLIALMVIVDVSKRENLTALKPSLEEARDRLPLLIFVNKGIEISTCSLTLEIIADTCGSKIAKVATFIVSATM